MIPLARTGRTARAVAALALAALAGPLVSGQALAQSPSPAGTGPIQRVTGRVVRPGAAGLIPVGDTWVTLHRVGRDTAGPLDSMRTGRDGRYNFRYRATGDESALYFVSALFGGIAYFSSPLRAAVVEGADAEITVFDTTSAALPVAVRGRHLVVSSVRPGQVREVIEVYELANDSSLTRIAPDSTTPVWTAVLPADASEFRVGQGDVAADAIAFRNGRLEVYSPIAPGLKQLSFSYFLPSDAFPLSVPVEQGATVLEVLLEDPGATVSGAQLSEVEPATVEGRTFRRFLAQDVPASAVARVEVPSPIGPNRTLYLYGVFVAVGGAMLFALARSFRRRPSPVPVAVAPAALEDDPDVLARYIAALDAEFERGAQTSEARAAHTVRRAELKARLAAALARSGRAG